jgi:hypothetical protein
MEFNLLGQKMPSFLLCCDTEMTDCNTYYKCEICEELREKPEGIQLCCGAFMQNFVTLRRCQYCGVIIQKSTTEMRNQAHRDRNLLPEVDFGLSRQRGHQVEATF